MIENKYNELCNISSDINEHLPVLRKYAEECESIIELGVRWVVSTIAFLSAKPKTLISVDITHPNNWGGSNNFEFAKQQADLLGIDFLFLEQNSISNELPERDLLFIDTWHSYRQLLAELRMHNNNTKKYIILHDTTLFANIDEDYYGSSGIYPEIGLWNAIQTFLKENNNWKLHKRLENNNGLTILIRNKYYE